MPELVPERYVGIAVRMPQPEAEEEVVRNRRHPVAVQQTQQLPEYRHIHQEHRVVAEPFGEVLGADVEQQVNLE